jgi:choline dehydrogenase-like flavoprotein
MTRLARSLAHLKPHYDVVVVGSGYGGGVSASRLARAGLRVAVLERGREFVTGEFPTRFPDLRAQMQISGRRYRLGPATGLYDVRFGDDMHVLIGCGLGGGSLINAGVALRPDPRVFADPVWPDEIRDDGLLSEGYARAEQHSSERLADERRTLDPSGSHAVAVGWSRASGELPPRSPCLENPARPGSPLPITEFRNTDCHDRFPLRQACADRRGGADRHRA